MEVKLRYHHTHNMEGRTDFHNSWPLVIWSNGHKEGRMMKPVSTQSGVSQHWLLPWASFYKDIAEIYPQARGEITVIRSLLPASSQCPFKEYNRVTRSHWLGPERRGENALGYELKDLSSSSSYYFWVCSCSKTMPANQSFLEWICACLVLSGGPSRCGSKDQHSVENARQQKQEAFFPNLPREAKRSRYFLNSENSLEKTPYCVGSNLQGFGGNALNF